MARKIDNLVLIDANFVLLPFQFKIDYLSEIESNLEGNTWFLVLEQTVQELLAKKNREAAASKFPQLLEAGLDYLKSRKGRFDVQFVNEIKSESESSDDFLLKRAYDLKKEFPKVYIATNDANLRKRAKELSIGAIFLRQKKYLSILRP